MPISAEYVTRETVSNLWRNRLMTIAAVLTVAVSLSLVGTTLLLKQGAAQATGAWQRGTDVIIFMKPNASSTELAAVNTQLKSLPYVNQPCKFWTQKQDFAEAQQLLGTAWNESGVTWTQTPSSYRCVPSHLQDALQIVTKFKGQPGVTTVSSPNSQIRTEEAVIKWLQIAFFVTAFVLLISAGVLILNTIRMAIFARRREVSVMKLVGATNWFIRLPFMSEGLLQGFAGSVLAALLVYGLHTLLNHFGTPVAHRNSLFAQMRMTGWQVFSTDAVVVIFGMAVGGIGSVIAIRRFLDV